jgi:hypothetical protein
LIDDIFKSHTGWGVAFSWRSRGEVGELHSFLEDNEYKIATLPAGELYIRIEGGKNFPVFKLDNLEAKMH